MGLGKSIQGIASMSVYFNEWPLLVLCPSSARYHWESEFQNWLGIDSFVNKPQDIKENVRSDDKASDDQIGGKTETNNLLHNWQIHVIASSKDKVIPFPDTKVVICSYGLATGLVEAGKIYPKQFRCAIVDESHMLKNKGAKRTASLIPILTATDRCVLLSGTPALARPGELWPQLEILKTAEQHSWWDNEEDFVEKYVKKGGSRERAELHTMLIGTVMIRRLKNDILKTMPRKLRQKAEIHVLSDAQKHEIKDLMFHLRQSKGALGTIARKHYTEVGGDEENPQEPSAREVPSKARASSEELDQAKAAAVIALETEMRKEYEEGRTRIHQSLAVNGLHLNVQERNNAAEKLEEQLSANMHRRYSERIASINYQFDRKETDMEEKENQRTQVLGRLYGLTGDTKIPLIVDMLNLWLRDPTKGKLCIFAHHLSVLNAIQEQAKLSNAQGSIRKYIRIDGSTLPKQRQAQIKAFQSDPSLRIALLGITAAGVAVTLTASSTVWFAELFWTPALMIQAEDRCHRIGQQAQVHCLYFVARGTLDEILWKLIEKKFRDLGEFVEGKEKQKLVVDKIYFSEKELKSIFDNVADSDDEGDFDIDDDTGLNALRLDEDLVHDIEQLGEEERMMLRLAENDDDEPDAVVSSDDRKRPASVAQTAPGESEEQAISLLDDDEEEEKQKSSSGSLSATAAGSGLAGENVSALAIATSLDQSSPLFANCRLYKMHFGGPSLGLEVRMYEGRVVVTSLTPERVLRLGPDSKPGVGHVLVAINGFVLPFIKTLQPILQYVKNGLKRPPLEMTFAEDSDFIEHYRFHLDEQLKQERKSAQMAGPDHVIDLLDDD